jgi:hypothetical protein
MAVLRTSYAGIQDHPLSAEPAYVRLFAGVLEPSTMTKIAMLIYLIWSASRALGCDCVVLSVQDTKKSAEVVFRGTIMDIRDGEVTFRVERVWKGNLGRTFKMPEASDMGCIGFDPIVLLPGNDLLVFAWRLHRYRDDNEYFTGKCARTGSASRQTDTLSKLGRGKPPRGGR